jgi:hypothetical protein
MCFLFQKGGHQLSRGERVIYHTAAGSDPVTGMVDGDTYIVSNVSSGRIFLSNENNVGVVILQSGT